MNLRKWIGSTFGSAYIIPYSPGTSTSLIVSIFLWVFKDFSNPIIIIFLAITCIILGLFSLKSFKEDDPRDFTLDETYIILLLSIFYTNSKVSYILGFLIFRFFDILKPFGIKFIEKKTKKYRLLSVYIDDFIAGIYTIIILKIILNFETF